MNAKRKSNSAGIVSWPEEERPRERLLSHGPQALTDAEISDPSPENQKKYKYAAHHFQRLNEWLEKAPLSVRYQLNFLTPKDYNKFFQQMRNNSLIGFRSALDVALRGP